jgi:hypothetical protein
MVSNEPMTAMILPRISNRQSFAEEWKAKEELTLLSI